MPDAIFEKKTLSKTNCSNVFGLPNSLCCIRKNGRLCISQIDKQQNPNEIQGGKKPKAGKVTDSKIEKAKNLKK